VRPKADVIPKDVGGRLDNANKQCDRKKSKLTRINRCKMVI